MLWLLLVAWLLGILVIWAVIRSGIRHGQPLTREQTERLREAAHEALRQIEARRAHLMIVKPSDSLDSQLVSRN
jgi:16S rRNA U1498 N3-methylase RsmE